MASAKEEQLVARAREATGHVVGRGWEDLGEITLVITDEGLYLRRAALATAQAARRLPVCGVGEFARADGMSDGSWRVTLELAGRVCWPLELYCQTGANAAHAKRWTELLRTRFGLPPAGSRRRGRRRRQRKQQQACSGGNGCVRTHKTGKGADTDMNLCAATRVDAVGTGPSKGTDGTLSASEALQADTTSAAYLAMYATDVAPTILTVGDGDLSFSLALARYRAGAGTGGGGGIVATTYDSEAVVLQKYSAVGVAATIAELRRRGAWVLFGVDATSLAPSLDKASCSASRDEALSEDFGGGANNFTTTTCSNVEGSRAAPTRGFVRIVFMFPQAEGTSHVDAAQWQELQRRGAGAEAVRNRLLLAGFLRAIEDASSASNHSALICDPSEVGSGVGRSGGVSCTADRRGSCSLLHSTGEVHISQKDSGRYDGWRIEHAERWVMQLRRIETSDGGAQQNLSIPLISPKLSRLYCMPFASHVLEVLGYRTCNVNPLTTRADAARVTSTCTAARTHVFGFGQPTDSHLGASEVSDADTCPVCCVVHSSAAARAAHEAGAKHARALKIEQQWKNYVALLLEA